MSSQLRTATVTLAGREFTIRELTFDRLIDFLDRGEATEERQRKGELTAGAAALALLEQVALAMPEATLEELRKLPIKVHELRDAMLRVQELAGLMQSAADGGGDPNPPGAGTTFSPSSSPAPDGAGSTSASA